jgi:hypothetical protein
VTSKYDAGVRRSRWLGPVGLPALASLLFACMPPRTGGAPSTPIHEETLVRPPIGESPVNAHAPSPSPPAPPAPPGPELPRGGYSLFPTFQLVGFCGTPGAPALGELDGNLPAKAKKLQGYAAKYAGSRTVLPAFELIAVIVLAGPGGDGKYRRRVSDKVVDDYLRIARQNQGLLILNIQPGQSDFLSEVKHFEKYLREPDVGVALDPEWAMKPGQMPGRFFGQTTGTAVSEVAAYLSSLVQEGNLPEKALVFHQVNGGVVKDSASIKPSPGVVVIESVDGLGPKHAKIETYDYLMRHLPEGVHPGFKLFFDEDQRNGGILMTPREVMELLPVPEYVMYE